MNLRSESSKRCVFAHGLALLAAALTSTVALACVNPLTLLLFPFVFSSVLSSAFLFGFPLYSLLRMIIPRWVNAFSATLVGFAIATMPTGTLFLYMPEIEPVRFEYTLDAAPGLLLIGGMGGLGGFVFWLTLRSFDCLPLPRVHRSVPG